MALSTQLNYIPHVYDKLVALSKEGYAVLANEKKNKHIPKAGWNGSVKALYELFDLVDDNDSKSSLLGSLNELVVQCNFVPSYSISSMLYMIA